MTLTDDIAARFVRIALGHVRQEYPNKLDHVLDADRDAVPPHVLHPVFHGSFDWHSCVHSYWLLLSILRLFPKTAGADAIAALADDMLTPEKLAGEIAYLQRPTSAGFERPYGWAWLLALHAEAVRHADRPWGKALRPLADVFAGRFRDFVPKQAYPVRAGTHGNTAFAFILALDWADIHEPRLAGLLRERARHYFAADRDCPAWEPGGDEFLSPAMVEALCMRRVLAADEYVVWLDAYLPRLSASEPATLFEPASVTDRADGKLVHLDGFNLSRAWAWRQLAPVVGDRAFDVAGRHIEASLPHIEESYMGSHWLCSFALLALMEITP